MYLFCNRREQLTKVDEYVDDGDEGDGGIATAIATNTDADDDNGEVVKDMAAMKEKSYVFGLFVRFNRMLCHHYGPFAFDDSTHTTEKQN